MKWFLSKAECRKNSWFTKKHLGTTKGIAVQVACQNSVKISKSKMYALVNSFENNGYALTESKQGQHERKWIVNNEIWALKCNEFIRKEACVKGKPNMTVCDFQINAIKKLVPQLRLGAETRGLSKQTIENGIS